MNKLLRGLGWVGNVVSMLLCVAITLVVWTPWNVLMIVFTMMLSTCVSNSDHLCCSPREMYEFLRGFLTNLCGVLKRFGTFRLVNFDYWFIAIASIIGWVYALVVLNR